jgi:hypothetical protein
LTSRSCEISAPDILRPATTRRLRCPRPVRWRTSMKSARERRSPATAICLVPRPFAGGNVSLTLVVKERRIVVGTIPIKRKNCCAGAEDISQETMLS